MSSISDIETRWKSEAGLLRKAWSDTKAVWRDEMARRFEEEYMNAIQAADDELTMCLRDVERCLDKIDRLNH